MNAKVEKQAGKNYVDFKDLEELQEISTKCVEAGYMLKVYFQDVHSNVNNLGTVEFWKGVK